MAISDLLGQPRKSFSGAVLAGSPKDRCGVLMAKPKNPKSPLMMHHRTTSLAWQNIMPKPVSRLAYEVL